jgi:putative hydrolase of the HAD superfamily
MQELLMHLNVKIFLDSPEFYQKLYQALFNRSGDVIPQAFSLNQNIQIRLVNCTTTDEAGMDQGQRDNGQELAYLDDRYDRLKDFLGTEIKTIWYNPGGEIISAALPIQDVDLDDFSGLAGVLEQLQKPSLAQCLDWWEVWEVPENIRRHSTVVAWSAYVLGMMMRKKGISLDPILAHRAGLVHDIDKMDTLEESGAHGVMGADFLVEQGYPEVGEIVRGHIMSTILHDDFESRSWENKLVFFCDKLVEGDELVPFDQRLAALKIRYPHYVKKMEKAESGIWNLSDEICGMLGIKSHEGLVEVLRERL